MDVRRNQLAIRSTPHPPKVDRIGARSTSYLEMAKSVYIRPQKLGVPALKSSRRALFNDYCYNSPRAINRDLRNHGYLDLAAESPIPQSPPPIHSSPSPHLRTQFKAPLVPSKDLAGILDLGAYNTVCGAVWYPGLRCL